MTQLADLLRVKRACTFDDLFEHARTRYEVVVTLPIASGLAPVLIRRGTRSESASRIHHALEELVGDLDELRCASIHEDDIELRFRAGTSPDIAVDVGARAVIDAWRSIEPSTSGAYR